jgi:hypothetical protein
MVTFTINIPLMLAYIPYMDPMGYIMENKKCLKPPTREKGICHYFWPQFLSLAQHSSA